MTRVFTESLRVPSGAYPVDFKLINIGFGNVVVASRVVSIVSPSSAPMKRLKDEAKKMGRLIDASQGRKTRSIIITDSGHVILSAIQTETVTQRFSGKFLPGALETEDEGSCSER